MSQVLQSRGAKCNTSVLVLNPVNLPLAIALRLSRYRVVLHLDGRDDLRTKWPKFVRVIIRFLQLIAVQSGLPIIVDSEVLARHYLAQGNGKQLHLIAYGGCRACDGNRRHGPDIKHFRAFLVVARAVRENQLGVICRAVSQMSNLATIEIITTWSEDSEAWEELSELSQSSPQIEVKSEGVWNSHSLCDRYLRSSAVIHGHSVGGTNPALVLALSHGTPVFAHDNPYNREVAGSLARYWKTEQELTKLLDEFDPVTWPYDQAAVDDFNRRYNWDDVVEKYKKVLGLDQSSGGGPLDRK